METGYIKIYRSLKSKGYYKDSQYIHLWVHLLMCATYQEKEYLFNGKIEYLKPGQFITGRQRLSKDTGIQESKIERILNCFESEQQIEQQNKSKFRIISICNWEEYQNNEQQIEQQMNSQRTASEQPVNTINNNKKEKNNKEPLVLPDWLDKELWNDFKEHRKKLRRPMSQKAEQILIKKMEHLMSQGEDPKYLLITAIERGWLSVFPSKGVDP
ncbi:MAG TPA: hypothetical protein VJ373_01945 [Desulfatiglandales bacterium]|nr:hypothetical protein [Desulfatiglandales bacterium]